MLGPNSSAPLTVDLLLGGRYRLVGPIARGGMAEVWEGYDEILSRPVAVKVLLSHLATDHVVRERFRREAVTAAGLAHPNVVSTYDTGLDAGVAYIVMELVPGRTLRQLLAERGALPVPMAVAIADQIAAALVPAHRSQLVHRDIKPANVLLTDGDGPVPHVKVTDFGIAKAAQSFGLDLTSTGMVLGTPKYLSPEQVEGREPDARADLYALGVVLYEMLTGEAPFTGTTEMATALAHLRDQAPPPSSRRHGIPPELDRVVATLLAKDPAHRYGSAVEVRRVLAGSAAAPVGSGPQPTRIVASRPADRSNGVQPQVSAGPGNTGSATSGAAIAGPIAAPDWRSAGHPTTVQPAAAHPTDVHPTAAHPTDVHRTAEEPVTSQPTGAHPTTVQPSAPPAPGRPSWAPIDQGAPPVPPRRAKRRGPGLVVAVLVLAGVALAAVLVNRSTTAATTPPGGVGGGGPGAPLPLQAARVFVLQGHTPDDAAGAANVLDGNAATVWTTDTYGNAHFGNLYPGIGLAVQLDTTHTLHSMVVASPRGGWSAQAYVAATFPAQATGVSVWGTPTSSAAATGTTTTFDLGGRSGGWVLLWLTSTGGPPYRVRIADISIR